MGKLLLRGALFVGASFDGSWAPYFANVSQKFVCNSSTKDFTIALT